MKLHSALINQLGGLGMATFLTSLKPTLDLCNAHYDVSADPARHEFHGRGIIVFWHEYIAVPFAAMGKCNISMLTSKHRDADWLSRAAEHLGYDVVRGSTNRGGAGAIRELKRKSEDWIVAITPDGPMGPRREMELGPIYLSSRLQIPLLPLGVGYDRPWRLPTWDRFAVPRPYSRCRMVWGPRMHIPPNLERDDLEHYRREVQQVVTCITTDAERWAESGSRRIGQQPFQRKVIRNRRRRDASASLSGPHDSSSSTGQRSASLSRRASGNSKPGIV